MLMSNPRSESYKEPPKSGKLCYDLTSLMPSVPDRVAPLLNDAVQSLSNGPVSWEDVSPPTVRFLPCPPCTKAQAYPRGPRSSLEQEDGEDDAEGETEG